MSNRKGNGSSRVAQLESSMMRRGTAGNAGSDAAMERLLSLSLREHGEGCGSEPDSPQRARERSFWNGPFSPSSRRQSPSAPKRLSSRYGKKAEGRLRRSGTPTSTRRDEQEIDPIAAVMRLLRAMDVNHAKGFVSDLLCTFADELGNMDTIMEARRFLHFERTRRNRLDPPPEGWDAVRAALIDFHGSARAAFANMCSGRRGGVMSAEELHRGMIAIDMPHVTEKVLCAVCPDEDVPADDIFIDFEEFMWIMGGCKVEVSPTLPPTQKEKVERQRDVSPRSSSAVSPRGYSDAIQRGPPTPSTLVLRGDSPQGASHGQSPPELTPEDCGTHHPTDMWEDSTSPPPQSAPVPTPSTRVPSLMASKSVAAAPKSPTYNKTPTVAPPGGLGTRLSVPPKLASAFAAGPLQFTAPPQSVPPERLASSDEDDMPAYPAKVQPSNLSHRASSMTVRPPSPASGVRPPSPAALRPVSPSSSRPPSPTASFRPTPASPLSPASVSLGGSLRDATIRRISSSIKSPVRRNSISRHPGMVTPPQAKPPAGPRDTDDAIPSFDASRNSFSATQTHGQTTSDIGTRHPSSPTSFKRPPVRRGSIASSINGFNDSTTSKGVRPAPPVLPASVLPASGSQDGGSQDRVSSSSSTSPPPSKPSHEGAATSPSRQDARASENMTTSI